MTSGGSDPPRRLPSHGNKGKEKPKPKKSRYVIKVLSQRDTPSTSGQSPSPSPVVAPTQSPSSVATATPSPTPSAVAPTPSPSLVAAATQSPSPTTTATPPSQQDIPSSSGLNVGNLSTNGHNSELEEEELPPNDRPMIEPVRGGFNPCRVASQAISKTIKQQFLHPWPTWGAMKENEKDAFFQRFKRMVMWRPEHEDQIRRNFHSKASHRLSEMFRDARLTNERPYWLGDDVWNRLLAHWNSASFRLKSAQASKNRGSEKGGTLHTGGSISTHDHAMRMAKEFGRSVYIDEVFQQTHIRKATGEFVDERSRKTHEDFQTKLSQARSEASSSVGESETSPLDPALEESIRTRCWVQAAGGKHKGRLYGVGELARGYRDGDSSLMLKRKAPSSTSNDSDEINQLRQEVRRTREDNDRLTRQFESFVGAVLQFLPPDAQTIVQQHQQQYNQQDHQNHRQDQQDDHQDQQQDDQHQQDDQQQQQQQQHSPDYSDY